MLPTARSVGSGLRTFLRTPMLDCPRRSSERGRAAQMMRWFRPDSKRWIGWRGFNGARLRAISCRLDHMDSTRRKLKRLASTSNPSKLAPPFQLICKLIVQRERAAGGRKRGLLSIGSWATTTCRLRSTIRPPVDVVMALLEMRKLEEADMTDRKS